MVCVTLYNAQLFISIAYIGIAGSTLLVKIYKPLNDLLLYGKTLTSTGTTSTRNQSRLQKLVSAVSSILRVPKSYFTHFYVLLSIFSTITWVVSYPAGAAANPSPTKYKNMIFINVLLWVQGSRRLYECLYISKFSKTSYINVSHYIAGMAHYTLVSLACYLGMRTYSSGESVSLVPTFLDWLIMFAYVVLARRQYYAHCHLASLVKYSLPNFKYVASPHYLQEIGIYAILFIFSVKDGWDIVSCNFLFALVFVTVNLSISSIETYRYYQEKFKGEFKLKWCIFPGVL